MHLIALLTLLAGPSLAGNPKHRAEPVRHSLISWTRSRIAARKNEAKPKVARGNEKTVAAFRAD